MEWSTHLLSGVIAGYLITGGEPKGAVIGGVAGIVSDLDEPKSKFGKILFPVSYPLNQLFGHRTFTHSLLFVLLLGVIFYFSLGKLFALAVMAGVLAHILGDVLTGKVKIFYPLKMGVGVSIPQHAFILMDRIARIALIIIILKIIWTDYFGHLAFWTN